MLLLIFVFLYLYVLCRCLVFLFYYSWVFRCLGDLLVVACVCFVVRIWICGLYYLGVCFVFCLV